MSILPDEIRKWLKDIGLPYNATDKEICDRLVSLKRLELHGKLERKAQMLLESLGVCPRWRVALPKNSQGKTAKAG